MKIVAKDMDDGLEVDMSPMIDMVFLLLIFFLVTATVIDEKIPVTVPDAVYAKVPPNIEGRFIIAVNKDEQIFAGLFPVTIDELRAYLQTEFDKDNDLRVQIRADGNVAFRVNEEIMNVCAEVGVMDMIFAAYEE